MNEHKIQDCRRIALTDFTLGEGQEPVDYDVCGAIHMCCPTCGRKIDDILDSPVRIDETRGECQENAGHEHISLQLEGSVRGECENCGPVDLDTRLLPGTAAAMAAASRTMAAAIRASRAGGGLAFNPHERRN